jgi:predicted DNA-binding protein
MALTAEDFLTVTEPPEIAPARAFLLPLALCERLAALCAATGDAPHDVVLDAIALHLDELEGPIDV